MMKLFVSDTSPYARKCRIVIREWALTDRVEEIDSHPFKDGSDLLGANPLGRVPALINETGQAFPESGTICAYLYEKAGSPWPWDWVDARIDSLASGLLDLTVARRVEMVRDPALYSDTWIDRREAGIARTLDQLEGEGAGAHPPLTLGGLGLAVALDYLSFRYAQAEWQKDRPGLTGLHAFWSGRESFKLTSPPADA